MENWRPRPQNGCETLCFECLTSLVTQTLQRSIPQAARIPPLLTTKNRKLGQWTAWSTFQLFATFRGATHGLSIIDRTWS